MEPTLKHPHLCTRLNVSNSASLKTSSWPLLVVTTPGENTKLRLKMVLWSYITYSCVQDQVLLHQCPRQPCSWLPLLHPVSRRPIRQVRGRGHTLLRVWKVISVYFCLKQAFCKYDPLGLFLDPGLTGAAGLTVMWSKKEDRSDGAKHHDLIPRCSHTRTRQCSDPPPLLGGPQCPGEGEQSEGQTLSSCFMNFTWLFLKINVQIGNISTFCKLSVGCLRMLRPRLCGDCVRLCWLLR